MKTTFPTSYASGWAWFNIWRYSISLGGMKLSCDAHSSLNKWDQGDNEEIPRPSSNKFSDFHGNAYLGTSSCTSQRPKLLIAVSSISSSQVGVVWSVRLPISPEKWQRAVDPVIGHGHGSRAWHLTSVANGIIQMVMNLQYVSWAINPLSWILW